MRQFQVTGMSCATCSARVERAVGKVEGVTQCSVNLLTNSMGVEGTADDETIIRAVEAAGYGAVSKDRLAKMSDAGTNASLKSSLAEAAEALEDHETPKLRKRLLASLLFLLVLMYFSMGHMMFGFPIPGWLTGNHVAMGLLQLLLTVAVMVINQKFFISGFKSLLHGAPNMDTLVALGSATSFGYSVCVLFLMTDAVLKNDSAGVLQYMDDFYFESAAMILTLITVGKMLEARSKGKTTDALKGLMKLAPAVATILRDGQEVSVSVEEVAIGDIFLVKPGESIPVDGIVLEGESAVDESALTGESIPVDKGVNDKVSAACINRSGFLKCKASAVGKDTTLSQIIQMVSDASATKAPIAQIADKVSGVFVPAVLGIAALTFVIWLIAGYDVGFAIARAISVLVISCPCALGLATPVAIMVGNGVGAKNGILFKTAESIEETGRITTVVLDKTGTITTGKPKVTDLEASNEELLLKLAGALEKKSEHPLAGAVVEYVAARGVDLPDSSGFSVSPGNGLSAAIDGQMVHGGNLRYIETILSVPEDIKKQAEAFAIQGKTPLIFATETEILGIIAVADTLKEDSAEAIIQLKNMGIHVVMLTGDNEKTAKAIGMQAGVDEVIAEVLPDGKEAVIRNLKETGNVAMVGDGINDAPALVRADVGIAIGAGTDIAIDAADIVLMKSSLLDVPAAIRLSRGTLRNIKENLFWAFFYNVIGIPLAAGLYYPLWGWKLNPMFGAAAMSLSSFCVVTNALRINLLKIHDSSRDRKINKTTKEKENKSMTKTLHVKGMMCMHCEARVKKVLEELAEVSEAVVSHEEGTAIVTLTAEVSDETLVKTVTDQGYEVTSIN